MRITVTDQNGTEHKIDALEGWSVMEIIRDHDLNIKAECGGCLSCATCHVYVDKDWLGKLHPPRDDETDMLEAEAFAIEENSRLSCQILFTEELNGLKLTLAPGTEKDA